MNASKSLLQQESEKLARAWMRHERSVLRDYLVSDVEDPRINIQSIFSRHFLIREIFGDRFDSLIHCEYVFSGVLNWLLNLSREMGGTIDAEPVLHALEHRSDNAEGLEIPAFVTEAYAGLPARAGRAEIPNYIRSFLIGQEPDRREQCLNTFQRLWSTSLVDSPAPSPMRILEPACGSANDYRCLHSSGVARLIDYTGVDLCLKNIENARALFPGTRFEPANVFALDFPNQAFDCTFVHDLFEHLSLEGLEAAVSELCRVTRGALCLSFFNMDEIPKHIVRPTEDYHWNTLSMAATRGLFSDLGFSGQVVHIGTFLRRRVGVETTHNPNAYTFLLRRIPNVTDKTLEWA